MRLLPIALLCLLLAACGRDDTAPATTTGAADPAVANTDAATAAADQGGDPAPALPTGDFRIASVTLGSQVDAEGQVREAQETFQPGDRIHAAVVGVGHSDGLTLSARWRTADGTEIARAGQSLAPDAPTVTTFAIAQPEPWPAGAYHVDIAIDDTVVESRPFLIQ